MSKLNWRAKLSLTAIGAIVAASIVSMPTAASAQVSYADCLNLGGTVTDTTCTVVYDTPDSIGTFTVPDNVTSLSIKLTGGTGSSDDGIAGGRGDVMSLNIDVNPGDTFWAANSLSNTVSMPYGDGCQFSSGTTAGGASALIYGQNNEYAQAGGGGATGCAAVYQNDGWVVVDGGAGGDAGVSTIDDGRGQRGGDGHNDLNTDQFCVGGDPGFSNAVGDGGACDAYGSSGGGIDGGFGGGARSSGGSGGGGNFPGSGGGGSDTESMPGGGGGGGSSINTGFNLVEEGLVDTGTTASKVEISFASDPAPSTETAVTAYSFDNSSSKVSIYPNSHYIDVTVPYGTDTSFLFTEFALSNGATAYNLDGTMLTPGDLVDYSGDPFTFTVVAEDGVTTSTWTVGMTVEDPIYTSVTMTSPAAGNYTNGAQLTAGATLSDPTCGGAIRYWVGPNPYTGYRVLDLTSTSLDTTNWLPGHYTIAAIYDKTGSCLASYNSVAINVNTPTTTTISAPTTAAVNKGDSISPSASVSPVSCSTSGASAVTYSLNKNPTTGVTGDYALTGASWSTSGWNTGVYTLTATYPGDPNAGTFCNGSTTSMQLTIASSNVVTTTTINSPSAGYVAAGTTLTGNASVSPNTCSTSGASAVTYALNKNPLTGASGSYALSGTSWSTNGWLTGNYTLTASYPGATGCLASSDTTAITITAASTTTSITSVSSYEVTAGTTVTGSVSVTPAWCSVSGASSVVWSLDANPLTGESGTYNLSGSSWNTSGWLAGVYTLTASYPGASNCGSSQDSVTITIDPSNLTAGNAAVGGGWVSYSGNGGTSAGKANFGFEVQLMPKTKTTAAYYKGQVVFVQKGKWKFKGNLNNYGLLSGTPTTGQATGSGTLYVWDRSLNAGAGGWALASTGIGVKIQFQASVAGSKRSSAVPGSFGITFSGLGGSPSLPSTSLVALSGGNVNLY